MRIAIMQPYIFPYIGYFQLINAVDKFIIYDDVAFIKQGWINKNRILLNGTLFNFTIPLENSSSFKKINQTLLNKSFFKIWKEKYYKTLNQAYNKAPNYTHISQLIVDVLDQDLEDIASLAYYSLKTVCEYLEIKTEFVKSSTIYDNNHLSSQARIIDICKKENATKYINPIGGVELYSINEFNAHNIRLNFLKSTDFKYFQFQNPYIPWLSIIDILMFNSIDTIKIFLTKYELL